MGLGEGRECLDGAQGARIPLEGLVEQAVALGGVVPHPGEGAADLAEGLVVELSAPAALHEAAGLAEPGGRLVQIEPAPVVAVVGQGELHVLDAALEPVERVTGQGVRAGGGHTAEGARGHTDAEPARGEALRQAGPWSQLPQRTCPVRASRPARSLLGHRRVRLTPRQRAVPQHGFHRGHQLGAMNHLDLGVEHWLGQLVETGGEGQQAALLGLFRCRGRCRSLGLLGRRGPVGQLLQGLGEGVRPPVRRYVRDHWRHLLSS